MIVSSHKIKNAPCQSGVVTISNNTQKYYARVQNACLQEYARGCTFWKLLSFFKNPILGKFIFARSKGCPPLGPNRKHPCPRTKWHVYRRPPVSSTMASLYGVCFGKGLTTYWTIPYLRQGQVVVQNKYGELLNKSRLTTDSGGPSILQQYYQ